MQIVSKEASQASTTMTVSTVRLHTYPARRISHHHLAVDHDENAASPAESFNSVAVQVCRETARPALPPPPVGRRPSSVSQNAMEDGLHLPRRSSDVVICRQPVLAFSASRPNPSRIPLCRTSLLAPASTTTISRDSLEVLPRDNRHESQHNRIERCDHHKMIPSTSLCETNAEPSKRRWITL